jgi:integrase
MATIYRRRTKEGKESKIWTADFWIDGRKFSRSTGRRTKREAEAVLPQIEAELRAELHRKSLGIERLTIDTLMGTWWTEHAQHLASAQRGIKYLIRSLFKAIPADLPLEDLSNKHIAAYVAARRRAGMKPASICRELDCLEGAYHMARDLWEHPVRPIAWKEHRPRLPERQVEKHLALSPALEVIGWLRSNGATHIAYAVAWSIYTGVRLSGTRNLDWTCVNLRERWADVKIKRKPGQREDRWRRKQLSLHAIALLIELGPKTSGPVFDLTNRVKHWQAARRAIGRSEVTWHGLRHSHATWMRKNAQGIEVVQRSLNHSHIATTMVYAHVDDTELVAALDNLPPLWDHGGNLLAFPPAIATSTKTASGK